VQLISCASLELCTSPKHEYGANTVFLHLTWVLRMASLTCMLPKSYTSSNCRMASPTSYNFTKSSNTYYGSEGVNRTNLELQC
jgi:hypothetical protein